MIHCILFKILFGISKITFQKTNILIWATLQSPLLLFSLFTHHFYAIWLGDYEAYMTQQHTVGGYPVMWSVYSIHKQLPYNWKNETMQFIISPHGEDLFHIVGFVVCIITFPWDDKISHCFKKKGGVGTRTTIVT